VWNPAAVNILYKMTSMTFEQKKNTKALAWTLGVHALLLLAFLLLKYTLPAHPQPEDLGMEVNLGTSENGFGTDQPEDPEDPAAEAASAARAAAASAEASEREVHTSEDNDAPSLPPAKPQARRRDPQPVQRETPRTPNQTVARSSSAASRPAQSPRYVYPGATGRGGNSAQSSRPGGNEGVGQGDGDMGVPGGTPGAANYSGVPGGGGASFAHSITGRSLVSRPDPKAEFREGGKVVIRVTVNREGAITDYRVVSAANATIRALALKKLQSVRFNKSPSAPAEQFGNITFDFRATRK